MLQERGVKSRVSTWATDLAEALYRLGQDDQALRLTEVGEQLGAPNHMMTQVEWRLVRAKVLARRGDVGRGEGLAREAVTMAATTDDFGLRGNALMALSEVLAVAGRSRHAASSIREALACPLAEREQVRLHPYYTERILARSELLEPMAGPGQLPGFPS